MPEFSLRIPNPHPPRAYGGKGAEGMKKEILAVALAVAYEIGRVAAMYLGNTIQEPVAQPGPHAHFFTGRGGGSVLGITQRLLLSCSKTKVTDFSSMVSRR